MVATTHNLTQQAHKGSSMPLETATYLADLNPANPAHSDQLNQDDSHMRLVKQVLKNQFPNWTSAALASTQAQIDAAVNGALGTATSIMAAGTAAAPGLQVLGSLTTGIFSSAAGHWSVSTGGVQALDIDGSQNATFAKNVTGQVFTGTGFVGPGAVPIGTPLMWMSDTLPTGYGTYAWANGQTVSRATYASLFAIFGTAYGAGDGTTTFNLPNFQEVTLVGKSGMGGAASPGRITNYVLTALGTVFGECLHLLGIGEIPAHTHTATVTDPGHKHNLRNNGGGTAIGVGGFTPNGEAPGAIVATSDTQTTGISVSNASVGGGGSHNNVQPSMAVNYIIRIA